MTCVSVFMVAIRAKVICLVLYLCFFVTFCMCFRVLLSV
jgi:hypothetical protein